MMDVFYGKSGLAQTKINSMEGQFPGREGNGTFAVFNVCEALFLRGGNDSAVGNQASSGIMKGRVDSQSMHHYSSFLASTGRKRKRRRTDRHLGLADFFPPPCGGGLDGGTPLLGSIALTLPPQPSPTRGEVWSGSSNASGSSKRNNSSAACTTNSGGTRARQS